MTPRRLRPNWPNIACAAVTATSVLLLTWGWLGVAADKVCEAGL